NSAVLPISFEGRTPPAAAKNQTPSKQNPPARYTVSSSQVARPKQSVLAEGGQHACKCGPLAWIRRFADGGGAPRRGDNRKPSPSRVDPRLRVDLVPE